MNETHMHAHFSKDRAPKHNGWNEQNAEFMCSIYSLNAYILKPRTLVYTVYGYTYTDIFRKRCTKFTMMVFLSKGGGMSRLGSVSVWGPPIYW